MGKKEGYSVMEYESSHHTQGQTLLPVNHTEDPEVDYGASPHTENQPLLPTHQPVEEHIPTHQPEPGNPMAAEMNFVADAVKAQLANVDYEKLAGTIAAGAVAEAKVFKDRIENGPQTFRAMALLGGAGMVICGAFGFISDFVTLSPIEATIQVYIALFGIVVVMLEGGKMLKTDKYENLVEKYCQFLALVQGRGIFYLFCGSLALAQWTLMNIILGSYMLFAGVLCVSAGAHASVKLKAAREVLKDETAVKEAFEKYDADHNGTLDIAELKELAQALGSEMTPNEIEASMLMLDISGDGRLDFSEFMHWWTDGEPTAGGYLV